MGYKLQITETAGEESRFITDVAIVPAMRQDNQRLTTIQDRLDQRGILPGKQYVDQAYMSGRHIAESLAQGIDLRGYVREGNTKSCPHFGPDLCTDKQTGRHLGVNAYHDLIQARRQEADSEAFKDEMHIRAGIEGTVSEIVRGHGARRARFRGTRKNQLQALFVAAATNLKRLARSLFLSSWTWEHHWRSSRSTV